VSGGDPGPTPPPGNGNGAGGGGRPDLDAADAAEVNTPVGLEEPPPDRPKPEFGVLDVQPVERAAAPTLNFRVKISDRSGRPVYTVALTALITIEPSLRRYDDTERANLVELFGEPERWVSTTQNFRWAQMDGLVPAFTGSTEFDLELPCTYDLEVSSAKYFDGLQGGEVPVRLHFNGNLFYQAGGGKLQLLTIPWDCSVRYSMPVEVWRRMIDWHYPFRGWAPLDRETVQRLATRRTELGLPTFDAAVRELLDNAEG